MEPETLRQLRGAADLTTDAVGATVGAIAEAHLAIMGQVYAPLGLLGPLAAPARGIAQIQTAITRGVYQTILGVNAVVACATTALLDRRDETH
ncbi:MAG: hypothetical protein HXY37_11995 [Chloroflexi bacterium]|nr:hypothetical protein [Chloroflexota bacterium]